MSEKEKALAIVKKAKADLESGKISRRDFNLIVMSFGALAGYTLFSSPASAWVATKMRKSGGSSFQIQRSLRFRSVVAAYLSRTFGTPTDNKKWTWSGWIKRGSVNTGARQYFLNRHIDNANTWRAAFDTNDTLFINETTASTTTMSSATTRVFRDPSAWFHLIIVVDTANATPANRNIIYINGVQATDVTNTNYSVGAACLFNVATAAHDLGRGYDVPTTSYKPFDGYLCEVNFIDGQALAPSSFGEINSTTSVWTAKKYTGTYGVNGFYLDFSDPTSTTTIGYDRSGNANNWTATNISVTAGITYDSMLDAPLGGGSGRGNYATMNPLWHTYSSAQIAVSNAGLTAKTTGTTDEDLSSTLKFDGKMYFEATLTSFSTAGTFVLGVGVCQAKSGVARLLSNSLLFYRTYSGAGGPGVSYDFLASFVAGAISNAGSAVMTTNDVLSFAVDTATGNVWAARNGVWVSGNPALGSAPSKTFTMSDGDLFAFISGRENSNTLDFNFGQKPFSYSAPTGFKALHTGNLPTPAIIKSNQYFNVTPYVGTSGVQSIVNSGSSQPDLVWIKNRAAANNHNLFDSVRGAGWVIFSSTNTVELNNTANFTSFNANGFSLASNGGDTNTSGVNYVAWQWKKGTTPGFDIVSYVGDGISGKTIAHTLGTVPKMIIVRNRNSAGTPDWAVYHANANAAPASGVLGLNATYSFFTTGGPNLWWNNTAPTSSVFSVGSSGMTNESGKNHIAYLFAEVDGFSKISSYTGNGSADGPFIYCGFKPAFIMIKRADSGAENWHIADNGRSPNNADTARLWANLSTAEASVVVLDKVSNGFKIRESSTATNASGGTYIFMAFAEAPFKYANAK